MKHYYEMNIVEIREEYTNFLINIITPLLYEGVQSLYNYALKTSNQLEQQKKISSVDNPGILKIFQTVLKELPDLNTNQIENETSRIKEASRCSEWFDDLLKAVIKSNIVLLTYSTSGKKSQLVEAKYHERIQTKDFVHKCYIEMARAFYDNPELFRHDYPSLKIKKNQRETCTIIRSCARQAIRKMLPIKLILQEYLTNDYVDDNGFRRLNDGDYVGVRDMVNRDLNLLDSDDDYDPDKPDNGDGDGDGDGDSDSGTGTGTGTGKKESRNSYELLENSSDVKRSSNSDDTPSDMVTSIERSLMNIGVQAEGPSKDTSDRQRETFVIKQAMKDEENPIGTQLPTQHLNQHQLVQLPQKHIPIPQNQNIGPGIPQVDVDPELQQFVAANPNVVTDPTELQLRKKRKTKDEIRFLNEVKNEVDQLNDVKKDSYVHKQQSQPDMKQFFAQYQ